MCEGGKTQEGGLNCVLKVKTFSQVKTKFAADSTQNNNETEREKERHKIYTGSSHKPRVRPVPLHFQGLLTKISQDYKMLKHNSKRLL